MVDTVLDLVCQVSRGLICMYMCLGFDALRCTFISLCKTRLVGLRKEHIFPTSSQNATVRALGPSVLPTPPVTPRASPPCALLPLAWAPENPSLPLVSLQLPPRCLLSASFLWVSGSPRLTWPVPISVLDEPFPWVLSHRTLETRLWAHTILALRAPLLLLG